MKLFKFLRGAGDKAVNKRAIAEEKPLVAHTIDLAEQDSEAENDSSVRSGRDGDGEMFRRLLEVTTEAANDNIEIRALHCDPETRMGELAISVNHLLDMTDAFLREAGASLEHAGENKFYRRVLLRGMRGTFRHKAELINQALEKMSSNNASLKEAERLILTSAKMAQDAVRETSEASATVKRLGEASSHIGEVVKLISQIASQTNLLAINAKIEAAHVGEAGRGFKVVADEVRSLAQKTADATGGISRDITAITEEITRTTVAMATLSKSIIEMQEISANIERVVTDQKNRNATATSRSTRGNHARTER